MIEDQPDWNSIFEPKSSLPRKGALPDISLDVENEFSSLFSKNARSQSRESLRRYGAFISAVMETPTHKDRWPGALDILCPLLEADTAHIGMLERQKHRGRIVHGSSGTDTYVHFYNAHYNRFDLCHQIVEKLISHQVVRSDEVFANRDIETNPFYSDWMAPQKLYHCIWAAISISTHHVKHLTLFRSVDVGPFRPETTHKLKSLLPYINRAVHLSERIESQERETNLLRSILANLPVGLCLLQDSGKLVPTNDPARTLLSTATSDALQALVHLAQQANGPEIETAPSLRVLKANGQGSFVVTATNTVSPIGSPLLLLHDQQAAQTTGTEWLADGFGLTPAEREIAEQIATGATTQDIANKLKTSINTVRAHLKNIYAKTNTNRQSTLMKLVLCGPSAKS